MSTTLRTLIQQKVEKGLITDAINLLSQQIWCWGKDIERPEGNWLLEMGFQRIKPPKDRKKGTSVYSLELSENRYIVLRAFGLFYGDSRYGGIFLPRFEFLPKYTKKWILEQPPWSKKDLPELKNPNESQQTNCDTLMLGLINWIKTYEENIIENLGIKYRNDTLIDWDNGDRTVIPAEQIILKWSLLESKFLDLF